MAAKKVKPGSLTVINGEVVPIPEIPIKNGIVIGFDPSLRNTGVVVWDTNTWSLLYQTTIKNPPKSAQEMESYNTIYNAVTALLFQYKPDCAFVEKMFMSKSTDITQMLFQAQFMVRLACHDSQYPCRVIPTCGNQGWQTFVLGSEYKDSKGIRKIIARRKVEKGLEVSFANEHQADAGAIGLTGSFVFFHRDYRIATLKEAV